MSEISGGTWETLGTHIDQCIRILQTYEPNHWHKQISVKPF